MSRASLSFQPSADFEAVHLGQEAVHLGHHHVQQDEVRRPLPGFLQGLLAVIGFDNFIAVHFQRITQQHAVGFVVVHDQHESARAQGAGGGGFILDQGFSLHIGRGFEVR